MTLWGPPFFFGKFHYKLQWKESRKKSESVWHAKWNISCSLDLLCVFIRWRAHRKWEKKLGRWLAGLSVYHFQEAQQDLWVLVKPGGNSPKLYFGASLVQSVANRYVLLSFNKLVPKSFGSKMKTCCPVRKSLRCSFCSSFNEKMLLRCDETDKNCHD